MICVTVTESRSMGRICDSGSNEEIQMQQFASENKMCGWRFVQEARAGGVEVKCNRVRTGVFIC